MTRVGAARAWSVAGVVAGLALAAAGLAGAPVRGGVPDGAVAVVGGTPILRSDYDRALAAVAGARRDVDDGVRRKVLDRLIDEELLVQRGLELGLAERDPRVRADLGAAVIDLVTARAEAAPPSEADLRAFYADHRDEFARPPLIHVRQRFFRAADAAQPSPPPVPVPDAPIPLSRLADLLGPTAARAAAAAPVGATTARVRSALGWHELTVVDRRERDIPPYADIADEVAAAYRRRAGERALRAFLDRARARAGVQVQLP